MREAEVRWWEGRATTPKSKRWRQPARSASDSPGQKPQLSLFCDPRGARSSRGGHRASCPPAGGRPDLSIWNVT